MKVKLKYFIFSLLIVTLIFVGCEEEGVLPVEIPTAISFNLEQDVISVQPGGTQYELQLQSTAIADIDRTYSITLNEEDSTGEPSQYSIESNTITIPSGSLLGSTTISFDYDAIPLGESKMLVFNLDEISDENAFINTSRTSFTINYSAFCPFNEIAINIVFDAYASEISWELQDNTGVVVASDGGSWPDGLDVVNSITCLEDGVYTFVLFDSYGDGLADPGIATVSLSDGTILLSISGNFGSEQSESFTL